MPDLKAITKDTVVITGAAIGAAAGGPLGAAAVGLLIDLFWPTATDPDQYWNQVKDQVKEYIEEQSIADQKGRLEAILKGGSTGGGVKEWLDHSAEDKRTDRLVDLDHIISMLVDHDGDFVDLDRATATLPYFVQMASMHLLALASMIEELRNDPSLEADWSKEHYNLQWYQDEYQKKLRAYWTYSYLAVQSAVNERLSKINTGYLERGETEDGPFFCFQDNFPGIANPVHGAASEMMLEDYDRANDFRNSYIATIRQQSLKFWKETVLDISQIWGKDFIGGVAGRASACSYQGSLHIVYRGEDGPIFHLDCVTKAVVQLNGPESLTDAPLACGEPTAIDYNGDLHVTYVGTDAIVWDIYYSAGNAKWSKQQISYGGLTNAPAASTTTGLTALSFVCCGNQLHVTFQTGNPWEGGDIWDAWYDGIWHSQQLNSRGGLTNAPQAAPDGRLNKIVRLDEQHVIYRTREKGGGGNIWHVWWYDGTWHCEQLNNSGQTGAPMAFGDPTGIVYNNQQHVVYLDDNRNIWDVWYDWNNGTWNSQQIINGGQTSAPMAGGTPTVFVAGNQFHIVFQGYGDGSVWQAWYDGNWHPEQLNDGVISNAPRSDVWDAGLTAFVYNDEQHVLYRNDAGYLYDLYYAKSKWNWTMLIGHQED